MEPRWMVRQGDCREILKVLPSTWVDAIVTDPPYEIGFLGKSWDTTGVAFQPEVWKAALRVLKPGGHLLCFGSPRTYHRLTCAIEDAGFEVRDCLMWVHGQGMPKSKALLKPAYEPILLARRPGPVQPLNIGAGRIGPGRWPANVLLDEEAGELLDQQSGILTSGSNCIRRKEGYFGAGDTRHGGLGQAGDVQTTYGDSGGASRFFWCAKATQREKGADNPHPTVKPLALMHYLVGLVVPPGGLTLDPFCGSGTTGIACVESGRRFVGIEEKQTYVEVSMNRIRAATSKPTLAVPEEHFPRKVS